MKWLRRCNQNTTRSTGRSSIRAVCRNIQRQRSERQSLQRYAGGFVCSEVCCPCSLHTPPKIHLLQKTPENCKKGIDRPAKGQYDVHRICKRLHQALHTSVFRKLARVERIRLTRSKNAAFSAVLSRNMSYMPPSSDEKIHCFFSRVRSQSFRASSCVQCKARERRI